jgi:hypothetical protein
MLVLLDDGGCPIAATAHAWDRLLVRWRSFRLDRDLADGALPDATMELALRARTLVGMPTRRGLARSVRHMLAVSTRPPSPGYPPVPVCRDRVRACSAEFEELIRRLLAPWPVPAQGVAKARLLLTDGGGPLYRRASPDDLRSRVLEAADALAAI